MLQALVLTALVAVGLEFVPRKWRIRIFFLILYFVIVLTLMVIVPR